MTDEVGTVTGDLTLRTEVDEDGTLRVLVQYLGADEWYRITDAPTSLPADTSLASVHARLLDELRVSQPRVTSTDDDGPLTGLGGGRAE
jgi:hypothetical protein